MAQRTKDSVVNITHKGQYSRMNTFFFLVIFFSFLAVLDTKPRASHELENFSVTELHLKPLRNKNFCLWIHALVFNGAVPQFPIFVRSVGTFITSTSVCKCL